MLSADFFFETSLFKVLQMSSFPPIGPLQIHFIKLYFWFIKSLYKNGYCIFINALLKSMGKNLTFFFFFLLYKKIRLVDFIKLQKRNYNMP